MSYRDPILEELYFVRQKLLDECNGDLHELARRQSQIELPPGMRLISVEEVRNQQQAIDAAHEAAVASQS